jgi:hypothetical protein
MESKVELSERGGNGYRRNAARMAGGVSVTELLLRL